MSSGSINLVFVQVDNTDNVINDLKKVGYERQQLKTERPEELKYFRY